MSPDLTQFATVGDRFANQRPPVIRLDHLRRMTSPVGLWEHARNSMPRVEHAYCSVVAGDVGQAVPNGRPRDREVGDYLGESDTGCTDGQLGRA